MQNSNTKIKRENLIFLILVFFLDLAMLVVMYLFEGRFNSFSLKFLLRDILIFNLLILPVSLFNKWCIHRFNSKGVFNDTILQRTIRNLVFTFLVSIGALCLLYLIRVVIFSNYAYENWKNNFLELLVVNFIIIQTIEFFLYYVREKDEALELAHKQNQLLTLQYKMLKEKTKKQ